MDGRGMDGKNSEKKNLKNIPYIFVLCNVLTLLSAKNSIYIRYVVTSFFSLLTSL